MAGHQLLSLGLALACLLVAGVIWAAAGRPQPDLNPHLPAKPALASNSSAPGGAAAGMFGVAAQRNLQGAITASNDRAVSALNGTADR